MCLAPTTGNTALPAAARLRSYEVSEQVVVPGAIVPLMATPKGVDGAVFMTTLSVANFSNPTFLEGCFRAHDPAPTTTTTNEGGGRRRGGGGGGGGVGSNRDVVSETEEWWWQVPAKPFVDQSCALLCVSWCSVMTNIHCPCFREHTESSSIDYLELLSSLSLSSSSL